MKSYFKFLSRHRLFTIINIVGLCLSMAFLLLLGDLIYRQTSVENFQSRGERIFALGNEEFTMSHFRVGQKDRNCRTDSLRSKPGVLWLAMALPSISEAWRPKPIYW